MMAVTGIEPQPPGPPPTSPPTSWYPPYTGPVPTLVPGTGPPPTLYPSGYGGPGGSGGGGPAPSPAPAPSGGNYPTQPQPVEMKPEPPKTEPLPAPSPINAPPSPLEQLIARGYATPAEIGAYDPNMVARIRQEEPYRIIQTPQGEVVRVGPMIQRNGVWVPVSEGVTSKIIREQGGGSYGQPLEKPMFQSSAVLGSGENIKPLTPEQEQENLLYNIQYSQKPTFSAVNPYASGTKFGTVSENIYAAGSSFFLVASGISVIGLAEQGIFAAKSIAAGVSPVTLAKSMGSDIIETAAARPGPFWSSVVGAIAGGKVFGEGISDIRNTFRPDTKPIYEVTTARGVREVGTDIRVKGEKPYYARQDIELVGKSTYKTSKPPEIPMKYESIRMGTQDIVTEGGGMRLTFINKPSEHMVAIYDKTGALKATIPASAKAEIVSIQKLQAAKIMENELFEASSGNMRAAMMGSSDYRAMTASGPMYGVTTGYSDIVYVFVKPVKAPQAYLTFAAGAGSGKPFTIVPDIADKTISSSGVLMKTTSATERSAFSVADIAKAGLMFKPSRMIVGVTETAEQTYSAVPFAISGPVSTTLGTRTEGGMNMRAAPTLQPQSFKVSPTLKFGDIQKPEQKVTNIQTQPMGQRQIPVQRLEEQQKQPQQQEQIFSQTTATRQGQSFATQFQPGTTGFPLSERKSGWQPKREKRRMLPRGIGQKTSKQVLWLKRDPLTAMKEAFVTGQPRLPRVKATRENVRAFKAAEFGQQAGGFIFGPKRRGKR